MRSEAQVILREIEVTSILPLTLLFVCVAVHIFSHTYLTCRFIAFDTRLNTLTVSATERRHDNLDYFLLVLSYLLIFDYYLVIYLPLNLSQIDLEILRIKKVATAFKIFHMTFVSTTSNLCIHLAYITIACMYHFLFEIISIWVCFFRLVFCQFQFF